MKRSIKGIYPARKVNMGGVFLEQPLPIYDIDQIDPFLLIHHWDRPLKGDQKQNEVGVGPHPHRGFSPVTIIFKGAVHHQDSQGGNSIVEAGGAQWMHSGKGIVHSERPSKELAQKGGDFEIIQFWVNVPANNKMVQAAYYPVHENDMPQISSNDGKIKVSVLTGKFGGKKGPIKTFTEMEVLILESKAGGKLDIPVPESYNALMYQLNGKMILNDSFQIGDKQMAWFKENGDEISIECVEDSRAILLAGQPINEEVATYGPYVMNTQTEIMEALRDFNMGKMGVLIEEFN